MMSRRIIITYLFCIFFSVNCDLNKEEGAACEWEGVNGTCVLSHRCFTTLDERSPKQPVCSQRGQETIICCTDCELVNDTRNAVISPTSHFYWKTGQKARDQCLDYLKQLPYECRLSYYSGVKRELYTEKKCHVYSMWGIGGPPARGRVPRNKYPHMVLLGYGEGLQSVQWLCGGSIITDRYVLTSAQCASNAQAGPLKYVAYGILNRASPTDKMKTVSIKRIVKHPNYRPQTEHNDMALVELESPITFNKNVLPACLHVVLDSYDEEAEVTTWRDPEGDYSVLTDTPSVIKVKKYGEEECSSNYAPDRSLVGRGFDNETQLCYGDKDHPTRSCKTSGGEPLLIRTQFSWCFHTIIGLTSHKRPCANNQGYDVYTKVSYFVPWIESIVWP